VSPPTSFEDSGKSIGNRPNVLAGIDRPTLGHVLELEAIDSMPVYWTFSMKIGAPEKHFTPYRHTQVEEVCLFLPAKAAGAYNRQHVPCTSPLREVECPRS